MNEKREGARSGAPPPKASAVASVLRVEGDGDTRKDAWELLSLARDPEGCEHDDDAPCEDCLRDEAEWRRYDHDRDQWAAGL